MTTTEDPWVDVAPPPEPPESAPRPPANGQAAAVDRTPPHDLAAEQAVLGAAILAPDTIPDIAGIIDGPDFHRPAHELVWNTLVDLHATGQPIDPVLLLAELQRRGHAQRAGGATYLHTLLAEVPTATNATFYANIVAEHAAARKLIELGTWVVQAGYGAAEPDTIRQRLELHLTDRERALPRADILTVDELLAQDYDEEPAWLIPNLLERGDRLILTAGEGDGKSTLLRQIGVMCAAGIHPLRGIPMDPIAVMIVDLENSHRQTRRKIRPLRTQVGKQLDPERLRIEVRVQGLDLTQATDVAWLTAAVARYQPDLLITGPVYKMATGDPNEEKSAKPVAMAIDRIRADHDIAVILEAHNAKAPAGSKNRPKEPYGWSGWMRWPEFGIHLAKDGTLTHWRGQRDERDWPDLLHRGGHWPWMPANQATVDEQWALIHQALTAAGGPLPNRELARQTGIPETSVRRLIDRNGRRLAALLDHLAEGDHDDA